MAIRFLLSKELPKGSTELLSPFLLLTFLEKSLWPFSRPLWSFQIPHRDYILPLKSELWLWITSASKETFPFISQKKSFLQPDIFSKIGKNKAQRSPMILWYYDIIKILWHNKDMMILPYLFRNGEQYSQRPLPIKWGK